MANAKGAKARQVAPVQKSKPLANDNVSDNESSIDVRMEDEPEKDEDEEELERLVFGDSEGFRQGLKGFADEQDEDDEEPGATGLEGLDNADLFFMDTADGDGSNQMVVATADSDDDDTLRSRHPAAWEDSDDERMLVSLASVPRLRKLRKTEAEDVVNGKEYGKRLRRQFELLNPKPEWALQATQQPAKKKRRLSRMDGEDEDELSDEDMDLDDDNVPSVAPLSKLLQDAESLVRKSGPGAGKKRKIRPEVIDIQRTPDIGGVQPSAITSLSFHPQLPLLLSSGPSSTLYLHQIASSPPAPTPNPLLTSMHIRGAALTTTAFHPNDSRIFLSARRRYFHVWNLQTGRVEKVARVYGHQHEQRTMERFKLSPDGSYMALIGSSKKGGGVITILSAPTLQWACQIRVESRGGIADFAWWRDSKGLCIVGKNGEVTEWSVNSQSVVARWQDEGAVGTTTLILGGHHELVKSPISNDRWVVIGSSSGIVNIYDRRVWLSVSGASATSTNAAGIPSAPTPTRTLDHLTTPISNLAFSPDGQILAISSKWKRDSIRLIHLPTCTVYKNWPTSKTPLGRITGLAFCSGENSGDEKDGVHSLLAVANEQGKIRVWEIR